MYVLCGSNIIAAHCEENYFMNAVRVIIHGVVH